jgi:NOL1/NOP2/sun family putative RNA methylase
LRLLCALSGKPVLQVVRIRTNSEKRQGFHETTIFAYFNYSILSLKIQIIHIFPVEFEEHLGHIPGLDSKALLEAISSATAPVSVRYNRLKMPADDLPEHKIPWCSTGYYLQEARKFITDPLWHAGVYYVQEASSMLLWAVLDALYTGKEKPALILDLCAAPGGKTTLISDWLEGTGFLVANEIIPKRYKILEENITRWGQGMVALTNTRPETFADSGIQFELIVVDAPCSGEGLFRKDPKAMQEWTPDSNLKCSIRQKDILDNAWQALKPGGHLIYSTCTYSKFENEAVLDYMVDRYGASVVSQEFPDAWGFVKSELKTGHAYRAYPHLVNGEGFFTGVLQKAPNDLLSETSERYKPDTYRFFKPIDISGQKNAIKNKHAYAFYQNRETVFAIPQQMKSVFEGLNDSLPLKWAGIPAYTQQHQIEIPHVGLALRADVELSAEKVALSREDALNYLRGNAVAAVQKTSHAWLIAAFEGHALGWAKNAGTRLNNQYPKSWRIKHY